MGFLDFLLQWGDLVWCKLGGTAGARFSSKVARSMKSGFYQVECRSRNFKMTNHLIDDHISISFFVGVEPVVRGHDLRLLSDREGCARSSSLRNRG